MIDDMEAFKALGDPVRLRILGFLLDLHGRPGRWPGRVCACDLMEWVGLSQPAVSHHMHILARAGLVTGERAGKWMHYTANPARFAALAAGLHAVAERAQIADA